MTPTFASREAAERAERALSRGTWGITAGAVVYSVLTVTPLVERVTPDGWGWTAPLLPLVVDAAVITSVKLDATVSRLGERTGGWATLLRWMTGLMTLGLNIGDSALKGDWTGVAVHAVIPLILIVIADAGLSWRRSITRALERIERAEAAAREHAAAEAERRERERLQREQEERDRAEQLERERLEAERRERAEEREQLLQLERERIAAAERRAAAEREERAEERRQAAEEARRRAEATARPAPTPVQQPTPVPTPESAGPEGDAPIPEKLPEHVARELIAAHAHTDTMRQLADKTGWSLGWVSARVRELAPIGAGGGQR
ncbi:DUF2637 domain-containing protein [Streptomyces sp. NPDC093595]|uniref:DUF2637 domain-containing protein n=1 Tax=Streptomyces sp. NPDC093595 TaxID=3366045 RepID=UPI0038118FA9